jgi:hypothetical protein
VTQNLQSKLDDPDMHAAPEALLRAARRAREVARRTGTKLIVVQNGQLRELDPDSPELDAVDEAISRDDD